MSKNIDYDLSLPNTDEAERLPLEVALEYRRAIPKSPDLRASA